MHRTKSMGHVRTAAPRRRWVRMLLPVIVLAAVSTNHPASSAPDSLAAEGTLNRFPADSVAAFGDRILPAFQGDPRGFLGGTLVGVPQRNELWQLYPTSTSTPHTTAVAVRDADSLKIKKAFELPLPVARSTRSADAGDWMHAFDGDRRAFFMATHNAAGVNTWVLMEVDMRTYEQRQMPLGSAPVIAGQRNQMLSPAGMEFDPYEKDGGAMLFLFGGIPSTTGANVAAVVHRVKLNGEATTDRTIRTCNGPLPPADQSQTTQLEGIIRQDYVYFACQRAGSIGAVVRIERDKLFDQQSQEDIVAGPAYLESAFADPESGRMFLVTLAGEIWAFDTHTMAFVGVIAGGAEGDSAPRASFGLDRLTGRFFFQSPALGVGIAEGRFYPIPQARTYPDKAAPAQDRIISTGRNGRIFVLTGSQSDRAQAYTIYNVGTAPAPPPPADPDQNTADIDEQEGVTEARYFGNSSGYGIRTLLAKGIHAVPPAPAVGQQAPTADIFVTHINSKCGFNDRELMAGRVAKAEYDTGSTAAQAVGLDVDERTKLDMEHLSRCDVSVPSASAVFKGVFSTAPPVIAACDEGAAALTPDGRTCDSGRPWTTKPAYCTSSTGGQTDGRNKSENEEGGEAETHCPEPGGVLEAKATGQLSGPFAGRAESITEIRRDEKGFLVSTVTSEAQDITIGTSTAFRIGKVTATATSRSNGRPSKADMSSYTFEVQGISIVTPGNTAVLCQRYKEVIRSTDKTAEAENCDIAKTMATLNNAAFGRAEFRLASGLDTELLQGTDGGALTAVQKSNARQASDQALVGDKTTEVPALEMVVYNDNKPFGRARQIYQFAGVSTAATYNIALLPAGFGGGDDGPEDGESEDGGWMEGSAGTEGTSGTENTTVGTPASTDGGGSTLGNLGRALLRGIRMFFTNPRHALLLLTAWSLFSLPPVLSRRRRLLAAARSV